MPFTTWLSSSRVSPLSSLTSHSLSLLFFNYPIESILIIVYGLRRFFTALT
jgi:hypothetical protein